MIAEQERNEVLASLAHTQNEELFQQVLELVRNKEQPVEPRQRFASYADIGLQTRWA